MALAQFFCSGTPLRPKAARVELTLRGMLVIFYGHGQRNGSQARAPYVHTSHFMSIGRRVDRLHSL